MATLTLDEASRAVLVNGQRVELTPVEYDLLKYLMENPNRTLSKAQLYGHVWGSTGYNRNTLAVTIARLRTKLLQGTVGNIRTVHGLGYKYVP